MMANTEVIKEPRGFIKFIQIVLAIFAFATTTAYNCSTSFTIGCPSNNSTTPTMEGGSFSFGYAFRLNGQSIPICSNQTVSMSGDYSAPSEFYVFVGVMAFLYSLAAIVFYVFADDKYRQIDWIPSADFITTVVFVLLWLIASCAWAAGVTGLKNATNPTAFLLNEGQMPSDTNVVFGGSYASLNVSIIFGFLNMCVWGANIWFLYKETKWFGGPSQNPSTDPPPPGSVENPQQRI